VCIAPKEGWFFQTPIYTGRWPFKKKLQCIGPDMHEVVTVIATREPELVWLAEYPNHGYPFRECFFEPLPELDEVYEILAKQPFER